MWHEQSFTWELRTMWQGLGFGWWVLGRMWSVEFDESGSWGTYTDQGRKRSQTAIQIQECQWWESLNGCFLQGWVCTKGREKNHPGHHGWTLDKWMSQSFPEAARVIQFRDSQTRIGVAKAGRREKQELLSDEYSLATQKSMGQGWWQWSLRMWKDLMPFYCTFWNDFSGKFSTVLYKFWSHYNIFTWIKAAKEKKNN